MCTFVYRLVARSLGGIPLSGVCNIAIIIIVIVIMIMIMILILILILIIMIS